MNRFGMKFKMMTAAAALAAALALPGMAAFAQTATVTASDVNVRSEASTSSDIVGTVTSGETYDVGETATDDTGATWYQITLSDGSTGYIRSDFVEVSEDAAESDTAATASTEEAAAEATTESTDTTSTDTGDYSIQLAPDENGDYYYYLYDNAAGKRMKIDDIEALQTQVTDLESQVQTAGNKYRVLIIVLAVLLVAAAAAAIAMFVRLRDALTNGRKERDLTAERRQERNRNPEADNLDSLRRGTREARNRDARNNAYPSGTREGMPARRTAESRPVREGQQPVRRTTEGRPVQGQPVRRSTEGTAARPVREGQQVRRPVQNPNGTAQRTVQGQQVRRPVQNPNGTTQRTTQGQQVRRPVQNPNGTAQGQTTRRPVQQDQQNTRQQAKEYVGDDDFDYDFISLDDK